MDSAVPFVMAPPRPTKATVHGPYVCERVTDCQKVISRKHSVMEDSVMYDGTLSSLKVLSRKS